MTDLESIREWPVYNRPFSDRKKVEKKVEKKAKKSVKMVDIGDLMLYICFISKLKYKFKTENYGKNIKKNCKN